MLFDIVKLEVMLQKVGDDFKVKWGRKGQILGLEG